MNPHVSPHLTPVPVPSVISWCHQNSKPLAVTMGGIDQIKMDFQICIRSLNEFDVAIISSSFLFFIFMEFKVNAWPRLDLAPHDKFSYQHR